MDEYEKWMRGQAMLERIQGVKKGGVYKGRKETRKGGDRHKGKRTNYQREYGRKRQEWKEGGGVNVTAPFVGVDGEGGDRECDGRHVYFMLRAGEKVIRAKEGEFLNGRLSTWECLDFLCGLDQGKIYVGFFFDYDVTKILEDLSDEKLDRLVHPEKRTRRDGKQKFPVGWREFEIDYIPRKEFRVRKKIGEIEGDEGETKSKFGPWVIINDVGSFFQCSFVTALERWNVGTDEEREAIAKDKERRASFEKWDEGVDQYNAMECQLLVDMMDKFRDACVRVGYVPKKWQGPGQLAEAAFRRHGVPKTKDVEIFWDDEYSELMEYAVNAFYGGRPELMGIGPVNRPVWCNDINSAYPYAMGFVPCMVHGLWEKGRGGSGGEGFPKADFERRSSYAICYGSFKEKRGVEGRTHWYGMPFRKKDGRILYPARGRGWYWNFEIEASIHQEFDCEDYWVYTKMCDCKPLDFVKGIYGLRIEWGKDAAGMILKLLMNSCYGKCVQSIGKPVYSNPIWGSFIIAVCRKMIQEFIHAGKFCRTGTGHCGKDVMMVATDSVCTWMDGDRGVEFDESKELGGWSKEYHGKGMFLIQPGVYYGSSGKAAKTRGVPQRAMGGLEQEFRQAFDRMVSSGNLRDGDVQVPQRMFVGIKAALMRKEGRRLLGQWVEFEDLETKVKGKTIRFDWSGKRDSERVNPPGLGHSYFETWPQLGDVGEVSTPYSKDIGGIRLREEMRELESIQPEWNIRMMVGEMSQEK